MAGPAARGPEGLDRGHQQHQHQHQHQLDTRKPVFIVLGKPGCGKTTLAVGLAKAMDLELISPQAVLETAGQYDPELGREISEAALVGREVSTQLVVKAMQAKLKAEETAFKGYVLEGVPASGRPSGAAVSPDLQLLTRATVGEHRNQKPVLIQLQIDDAELKARRTRQLVDPVTGIVYTSAQVDYSEAAIALAKAAEEGGAEDDERAGSSPDVNASSVSLAELEPITDVKELVWDPTLDEDLDPEPPADADDDEPEEEEDTPANRERRQMRLRRAATRKAVFSGICNWEALDEGVLQRLVRRPEDEIASVQKSLAEYTQHAAYLRTLVNAHFDNIRRIVVDATQNPDAVLLNVLQQIDQKRLFAAGRNVMPKRIGTPEKAAGFRSLPADDVIRYLSEVDLEPGLPRREVSVWGTYCPVTYYNDSSLAEGQFATSAAYKGKLYFLSSETTLKAFMANPDKFIAQLPRVASMKMCIMGGPFSGKSSHARLMAERYKLKVVDVDGYLSEWDRSPAQEELMKKSPVYAKIVRKCKSGKPITSDLLVDVIKLNLKDNSQEYRGWVLDGFPRTADQAQNLINAGLIPTYAVVLQNDINEQAVRDRGYNFKVNSRTGYPSNKAAPPPPPPTTARSGGRSESATRAAAQSIDIQELPFFDNLYNGFKEEYVEVIRILEDADVQVLSLQAELKKMTIFSMIQNAVDPFVHRAKLFQSSKLVEGVVMELGVTGEYCPHTLKTSKILRKGAKQLASTYKSRIYYAANEDARAAFITEPHNYLAQDDGTPLPIPPIRVAAIGAHGAGKTTILSHPQLSAFGAPHVDFDQYLETYKNRQQPDVAAEIDYMIKENAGILSPPVVVDILSTLFTHEPYVSKGFWLEGFPRSKMEAEIMIKQGFHVDAILNFKIEPDLAAERLQARRDRSRSLAEIEDAEHDMLVEYMDNCEKENLRFGDVANTIETQSQIPLVEVEANKSIRACLSIVRTRLRKFLDHRESLLCQPVSLEVEAARSILNHGAKAPSKFGKYCPVEHRKRKIVSNRLMGWLPVLWDGEVYFLRGDKNKEEFMVNTLYYLDQVPPEPVSRPHVSIIGRPKTGKTYLAKAIAEDLEVEVLTVSKAVQTLIGSQEGLLLKQELQGQLNEGRELSDDVCVRALHMVMSRASCQLNGYVLDGIPLTARQIELMRERGIIPHKVIEVALPESEVLARTGADWEQAVSLNIASFDVAEVVRERDACAERELAKIRDFLRANYSVLVRADGTKSKWQLRDRIRRHIESNIAQRQTHSRLVSCGKAAPMADLGVGVEAMKLQSSPLGRYCPVRLVDNEELVLSRESTELAVVYKDVYYWLSGPAELRKFLADAEMYTSKAALPAELPKRIAADELREMFPAQLEMQGYCPVTFVEGLEAGDGLAPLSSLVLSDQSNMATYEGKIYSMASPGQLDKFMRKPWLYTGRTLPKKLPPKRMPINVLSLPLLGFLEQSCSESLRNAMTAVSKVKPKYPDKDLEKSAVDYFALHLKANNPKSREFVRQHYAKKLAQYEQECRMVDDMVKYARMHANDTAASTESETTEQVLRQLEQLRMLGTRRRGIVSHQEETAGPVAKFTVRQ